MLKSPDATSTRSPDTTPPSSGPVRYTGVWKRWSGPMASSSVAVVNDFMIEPGTNSVLPPSSNSTSPVVASRTAMPKLAWASRSEDEMASIAARRSAGPELSSGASVLGAGATVVAVVAGAATVAVVVGSAPDPELVQAVAAANSRAATPTRVTAMVSLTIPPATATRHLDNSADDTALINRVSSEKGRATADSVDHRADHRVIG